MPLNSKASMGKAAQNADVLHAAASWCESVWLWLPGTGNHSLHLSGTSSGRLGFGQDGARVIGHLKADAQTSTASPAPLPAQALRFIPRSAGLWTGKNSVGEASFLQGGPPSPQGWPWAQRPEPLGGGREGQARGVTAAQGWTDPKGHTASARGKLS